MSTINRITGLATGMDTESIIEKLMEAERTPLDELEKEQTIIEWQREALLEINSKLLSFRSQASDMKLQGTYKSYTATSSNSSIVSAVANTDAQEGVYKVTVKQLATQTTLKGNQLTQNIRSKELDSYYPEDVDFSGKEFNVTYNGETKTIKFGDDADFSGDDGMDRMKEMLQSKLDDAFGAGQIQAVVSEIDVGIFDVSLSCANSLNLPITLTVSDEDNDALAMLGIEDGASTAFNTSRTLGGSGGLLADSAFTDGNITISVNGKDFTFSKNDTLSTVFSTLNKDTDADINIRYSNSQESIIVNRDSYGAGRELSLGGNSKFWSALGININSSAFLSKNTTVGKNAIFDISAPDGESAEEVQVSSNNFTYGGVSMTFLGAKEGEEVSITVGKNVDEIYNNIKEFVDSYNDLLGTLNKYYKEEKSGYDPLTDAERESLSETQEKQWEEKAKQGILRRDTTLQSAISSMRSAVTSYVNNSSISSLFQIGISTSSYDSVNSENNGKLEIDEDDLRQAIKDDIDGVAALFSNTASQIQGGKIDPTNLSDDSLTGKSFSITYGGETHKVTFSKGFDLSTSAGVNEFEDYLKNEFDKKFGEGTISVTYTNGKVLFNSVKGVDMQLNSDSSNDALSLMGIKDGAKYDSTEKGFAVKLYDICTTTMNSIIDKAGSTSNIVDNSTLGQALKRKKESISKLEERLETLEERYYNQFAAMEEAINKMNSQSESLVNMLSSN